MTLQTNNSYPGTQEKVNESLIIAGEIPEQEGEWLAVKVLSTTP